MKAKIVFVILLFITLPINAKSIKVCIDHYPPFQMLSPKPAGENISAINILAKIIKREVIFVEGYSFEYCIKLLKAGQVDILAGLNDNPQRHEFAYLLPYHQIENGVWLATAGLGELDTIASEFVLNGTVIKQLNIMMPSNSLNNLHFGISKKGGLSLSKTDIIKIDQAFQKGVFSDAISLFKKSHPNLYLNEVN